MAVGDAASAANYPLVPETGEEGRLHYGGREINRCRDYTAALLKMVPSGSNKWRSAMGFWAQNNNPQNPENGEIMFRSPVI